MTGMKIDEVKSTVKTQRISAHSHVKGLGLNEEGKPVKINTSGSGNLHTLLLRHNLVLKTYSFRRTCRPGRCEGSRGSDRRSDPVQEDGG